MVIAGRFGHQARTRGVVGKTRTWVSCIRNSNLPTHLVWKSYRFQLGPAVRFGLATLANQSDDIDNILHGLEFEMLSSMGINQHVKTEWRKLAREFGEIGLFNLTIEQFIGWAELILQHYGTGSTISKKMRASLVAVQLEIGCNGNPLNECHDTLGILATDGWIKAVWGRACRYDFKLTLDYAVQQAPRAGNISLLEIFLAKGVKGSDLLSLTQCRISHQAMYLSCIITAEGTHLDKPT